ncbi:molybdenum ABC transporter ATP-binding protein [Accumulibacter sp.]|uniref:molybdenum ABC transporter ATP-binding protein n=1 Tax=Accumulibacter sp. TaxID=2053492 RepID=UPI002613B987|nr:molybdenum ABC transporter ATP-binding protein [Accumulibacter sp.]
MSPEIRARFRIARRDFALEIDLTVPGRGITGVFGHSGSGKTTCLRAMAGLERAANGYFSIGDDVWQDESRRLFVPPHRRALGMVFQEASLFSHLSVLGNLRFAEQRAPERRFALHEIAALLGIEHLLPRSTERISGGERQRVAIARALLASPHILLMDEPMANLDLRRRDEILPYLERVHHELSLPIIYVSHSPDEVARLADHLVLLDRGQCIASGPLKQVLSRLDLPPAFADDAGVVIETRLAAQEPDDLSRLEFAGIPILVPRRDEPVGTLLRCRIHARDVSLALEPQAHSSILNNVAATVVDLVPSDSPGQVLVRLDVAGEALLARITRRSADKLRIRPGLAVTAQVKAVALLA